MRRRTLLWLLSPVGLAGLAAIWLWPLGGRRRIRHWWYWRNGPHPGRFQDPEGLAIDSRGNLYVGDEKRGQITMVEPGTGAAIATYKPGSGNRMVVTEPGRLFFLDTRGGVDCVIEVTMEGGGRELRSFTAPPAPGMPPFAPEGMALDRATGELYVTDEDGRRIVIFDRDGKVARTFPVDHLPEDVCLFEDRLYVSMPKAGWVSCYGKDGSFRFKFGKGELSQPETSAVSPDRKVYVSDNKGHKIEVYDLEGRHSFTIGRPGHDPGHFYRPQDILFDLSGNLVVADSDNHRVQVLTRAGVPIRIID
jgi:DNA-binding beta-propeller fold protein YncE